MRGPGLTLGEPGPRRLLESTDVERLLAVVAGVLFSGSSVTEALPDVTCPPER